MNINTTERVLQTDQVALNFVEFLKSNEEELNLFNAEVYFDFPIMKDLDDVVVISKLLVVSPNHGIIAISTTNTALKGNFISELRQLDNDLENLFSLIFSRLIRNKILRKSKTELAFSTNIAIFAPYSTTDAAIDFVINDIESAVIRNDKQLEDYFENHKSNETIPDNIFSELIATIEGAKGLIRPKSRDIDQTNENSKGNLANLVESEIASFDQRQKHGYMITLDGFQRIRGLAGSGKTVVLAMKAALIHLRNPESQILYTFHTKSLYQHIRRLITRFYRQFEDRDPDWTKLKVMHSWGGTTNEGVLYNACILSGVKPLTYPEALRGNRSNPFEFVCNYVLEKTNIFPTYDYVFIDEGQDFPTSFIQICLKLVEHNRAVFAYDELQNIFQVTTPTIGEIVGTHENGEPLVELSEDIVLYKCYRNPREIIVCAHALGFGLYSSRIVQMLENREQWEDVGYKVLEGEFIEGSHTVIERPTNNSLTSISERQTPEQIVEALSFENVTEEIQSTVENIRSNLTEGLRPDDILVIVVDDRNASAYFDSLTKKLFELDIYCNNLHSDTYGIRDFQKDGLVTLSTVHKAKGNEAYMVYVLGVDALFTSPARVRSRNRLFTAMTRAKGWVKVSGVGEGAEECKTEVETALENFPNLVFEYPSSEQLKVIKRDLADKDSKKLIAEKQLDNLLEMMSPDEIKKYITQKFSKTK